jgi:hypothetical protein
MSRPEPGAVVLPRVTGLLPGACAPVVLLPGDRVEAVVELTLDHSLGAGLLGGGLSLSLRASGVAREQVLTQLVSHRGWCHPASSARVMRQM